MVRLFTRFLASSLTSNAVCSATGTGKGKCTVPHIVPHIVLLDQGDTESSFAGPLKVVEIHVNRDTVGKKQFPLQKNAY